jgi:stage II sporulation protein M
MVKKRIRRKSNLWKESVRYILESKNYIILAGLLFVSGSLLGLVFASELGFMDETLKKLIEETENMNVFQLVFFIFQNNLTVAFLMILLGLFLGIFPIVNILANGAVLGFVFSKVENVNLVKAIFSLLPHGIFELPAIFISTGLGIKLGMFLFAKKRKEEFTKRFYGAMKVFFSIILPLLILAAIIEGLLIFFIK